MTPVKEFERLCESDNPDEAAALRLIQSHPALLPAFLLAALDTPCPPLVQLLFENGADPNCADPDDLRYPLSSNLKFAYDLEEPLCEENLALFEITRLFLSYGMDPFYSPVCTGESLFPDIVFDLFESYVPERPIWNLHPARVLLILIAWGFGKDHYLDLQVFQPIDDLHPEDYTCTIQEEAGGRLYLYYYAPDGTLAARL
ncbi:MAG: hypothetical protein IIV90_04505 [Oscillospiraceae bacterium]|nr:hypothetical protein [Oscillospiraceae bacterium]